MSKQLKILLTTLGLTTLLFLFVATKDPGALEANITNYFGIPEFNLSNDQMTALLIIVLGVAGAFLTYGFSQLEKDSLIKRYIRKISDHFAATEEEEVEEDSPRKSEARGSFKQDPFVARVLDEHEKTRYMKLGVGSGFKFGFGFGLGMFFAGIFIFTLSTVVFGLTFTTLFSSLVL